MQPVNARHFSLARLLCGCLWPSTLIAQQPEAEKPPPTNRAAAPAPARGTNNPIARIREEGLNRSQVMQTLSYLTDVVYLDARTEGELEKYKSKLKGAIVLVSSTRELQARFEPPGTRITDAELLKMANADVFDRIQADDLKQAAVIMAAFVYNAAMLDEKLPRKPVN